jgi:hypothetical protein
MELKVHSSKISISVSKLSSVPVYEEKDKFTDRTGARRMTMKSIQDVALRVLSCGFDSCMEQQEWYARYKIL